jgi:ergothioneine biosynthesis protein EgtB
MGNQLSSRTAHESAVDHLLQRYSQIREATRLLCEPLQTEDYVVQSMPDVSPTKWHLAHTTWFFETLLLVPHCPNYRQFNPHFAYLFNSYYLALGDRHCRQNRGLLSRPTVAEIFDYRDYMDDQMQQWVSSWDEAQCSSLGATFELGLNHEQQHQELMLTDIKHVFWVNPLRPAYRESAEQKPAMTSPLSFVSYPGGVQAIGYDGNGFAFDNESPRHRIFLEPFALGSRLITNGEYRAFMEDGGYQRGTHWLSEGWATAQQDQWDAPQYWLKQDGKWWAHTLSGLRAVEDSEPVCHVSYFEADAYARWAGTRLPTEAEWEVAACELPLEGNFMESGAYHPCPADASQRSDNPQQMFGDVWEWTQSPYAAYPGYKPFAGPAGEYNGKFMCNQFVLRGGSCATPASHIRATYRNFFPPAARWQFMGIRLAKDAQ